MSIAVLLAIIIVFALAAGYGRIGRRKAMHREIRAEQLHNMLSTGNVTVLDVREPREYAQGHIPGAILLPLGRLRGGLEGLPHDRPLVAVCLSGRRSATAVGIIAAAGFPEVYSLAGGMTAWPYKKV